MLDLYPILTLDIPVKEVKPFGFLEIINKQYHENINSAVYAHFINCEEAFVSDLFLNPLLELIKEKSGKDFSFGKAVATCEVVTEKGRIDIVITDKFSDKKILIENKIFFWLHNDLMDYWNYATCQDEDKVGVLLTPFLHKIPENVNGKFFNITHGEWISKVKENGLPFGLSSKHSTYITDFVNTIDNLYTSTKMNEQTKFYFQHAEKIRKIQETSDAANKFISEQFKLIAGKLGWKEYGNSTEWKNFKISNNEIDIFLTIYTGSLLKGENKYLIILELGKNDRENLAIIEKTVANHPKMQGKYRGDVNKYYFHFAVQEYTITIDEMANFAEIVYKNILKDFAELVLLIIKELNKDINISTWEQNFILHE